MTQRIPTKLLKKEICDGVGLRPGQFSVSKTRGSLAYCYRFVVRLRDDAADTKAQQMYDFLRQNQERLGLSESKDWDSDSYMPGDTIHLRLNVGIEFHGFTTDRWIDYPVYTPPPRPAPRVPTPLGQWADDTLGLSFSHRLTDAEIIQLVESLSLHVPEHLLPKQEKVDWVKEGL